MVHVAASRTAAAQTSMSPAAGPSSAAAGGVTLPVRAASYLYPAAGCLTADRWAERQHAHNHDELIHQPVHMPPIQPGSHRTHNTARRNAIPTLQRHPLPSVYGQLDGDSKEHSFVHPRNSVLLPTNTGGASALSRVPPSQLQVGKSAQPGHQSQGFHQETPSTCALKSETAAHVTNPYPHRPTCTVFTLQKQRSPPSMRSSSQEHAVYDSQHGVQGAQYQSMVLKKQPVTAAQALVSHFESFPQRYDALHRPFKTQQQQDTLKELTSDWQAHGASPDEPQNPSRANTPRKCSILEHATRRQHAISPGLKAAFDGSCEPQPPNCGGLEHPRKSNWLVAFRGKDRALLYYDTGCNNQARKRSGSCCEAAGAAGLSIGCKEEQLKPPACTTYHSGCITDFGKHRAAGIQEGVHTVRTEHLDTQEICTGLPTVKRLASTCTQNAASPPADQVLYKDHYSGSEELRQNLLQPGVLHQHVLRAPQQLNCRKPRASEGGERDISAHQYKKSTRCYGNTVEHDVVCPEVRKEMAGTECGCSRSTSAESVEDKMRHEEQRRQCSIASTEIRYASVGSSGVTPAASKEARHDLHRFSSPLPTTPKPHKCYPVADSHVDRPTSGRSASTFQTRGPVIRQSLIACQHDNTNFLLNPALTEALLVPSPSNQAQGTVPSKEPPPLLAVHVAVVKPLNSSSPRSYRAEDSFYEGVAQCRQDSRLIAPLHQSPRCLGGKRSALLLLKDKDNPGVDTLRRDTVPFRSASSPKLLSGRPCVIGRHLNSKSACSTGSTTSRSSTTCTCSGKGSSVSSSRQRSTCGDSSANSQTSSTILGDRADGSSCASPRRLGNRNGIPASEETQRRIVPQKKDTQLVSLKPGAYSRERWHHQASCAQVMQPGINSSRPKPYSYSKETPRARVGNAVSTIIPLHRKPSPAPPSAANNGVLVNTRRAAQSSPSRGTSAAADACQLSGVHHGANATAACTASRGDFSLGCQVEKLAGRMARAYSGMRVPRRAGNASEQVSPQSAKSDSSLHIDKSCSVTSRTAAAEMPASDRPIARVPDVHNSSSSVSTNPGLPACNSLRVSTERAGVRFREYTEGRPEDDGVKDKVTRRVLNQPADCLYRGHLHTSKASASSLPLTVKQASTTLRQDSQQSNQNKSPPPLRRSASDSSPVLCLRRPAGACTRRPAHETASSLAPTLAVNADVLSVDKKCVNSASVDSSSKDSPRDPRGQKTPGRPQHVEEQPVLRLSTFKFRVTTTGEDSRAKSPVSLTRALHQVGAQSHTQGPTVTHRDLRRLERRSESVNEELARLRQPDVPQQIEVGQPQQFMRDQLPRQRQQNNHSSEALNLKVPPKRGSPEALQEMPCPAEQCPRLEPILLEDRWYRSRWDEINVEPDRKKRTRRPHSMSGCKLIDRTSYPLRRSQGGICATMRKSFPTKKSDIMRLWRALEQYHACVGEKGQSGQDRDAGGEDQEGSRHPPYEQQQSAGSNYRSLCSRIFHDDRSTSCLEAGAKDEGLQRGLFDGQKGNSCPSKSPAECGSKTAAGGEPVKSSRIASPDSCPLEGMIEPSASNTFKTTQAISDADSSGASASQPVETSATSSPRKSWMETLSHHMPTGDNARDGDTDVAATDHTGATAYDAYDRPAAGEAPAAAQEAAEAIHTLTISERPKTQAQQKLIATTSEQCEERLDATTDPKNAHEEPVNETTNSHNRAEAATLDAPRTTGAVDDHRSVNFPEESAGGSGTERMKEATFESSMHCAGEPSAARDINSVARKVVTPRRTSIATRSDHSTFSPVKRVPLLHGGPTDSQTVRSRDAAPSTAAMQHDSDKSAGAVGSSAARGSPTREGSPPSTRSAPAQIKDTQDSLAFAVCAKLLSMGLLPIESFSAATAEWLHASHRGLHSSSQPPAEACKQVIAALASAACATEDEGRRFRTDARLSQRSATVAPTWALKRKEDTSYRMVTRPRLQRSRAGETADSTEIAISMQLRRDRNQRRRCDSYCSDKTQLQSQSRDALRERHLALLSRLQEKAKERLRSPSRAHSPSPGDVSPPSFAPRSVAGTVRKNSFLRPGTGAGHLCRLGLLDETCTTAARVPNASASSFCRGFGRAAADRKTTIGGRLHHHVSPTAPGCSRPCAASPHSMVSPLELTGGLTSGCTGTTNNPSHYAKLDSAYGTRRSASALHKSKAWLDCRSVEMSLTKRHTQRLVKEVASKFVNLEYRHYERQTTLLLTHDGLLDSNSPATAITVPWEISRTPVFPATAGKALTCSPPTHEPEQTVDCYELIHSVEQQQEQDFSTVSRHLQNAGPLHKERSMLDFSHQGKASGHHQRSRLFLHTELEQAVMKRQLASLRHEASSHSPPLRRHQDPEGQAEGDEIDNRDSICQYNSCAEQEGDTGDVDKTESSGSNSKAQILPCKDSLITGLSSKCTLSALCGASTPGESTSTDLMNKSVHGAQSCTANSTDVDVGDAGTERNTCTVDTRKTPEVQEPLLEADANNSETIVVNSESHLCFPKITSSSTSPANEPSVSHCAKELGNARPMAAAAALFCDRATALACTSFTGPSNSASIKQLPHEGQHSNAHGYAVYFCGERV